MLSVWRVTSLLLVALVSLGNGAIQSQSSPQAPRIEAKEQTKDSPQSNENTKANSQSIAPQPSVPLQSVPNIDANKRSEDTGNTSHEASEYWTIAGRPLKVTDTLLVAFTGLLFIATVFLYFATRSLVTGAEETARRQLRAYVGVERIAIQSSPTGAPNKGQIIIKNFGRTMAKDAQIWFAVAIEPVVPVAGFPLGNRKCKTVIMPTEGIQFDEPPTGTFDLRKGIDNVYLWGR